MSEDEKTLKGNVSRIHKPKESKQLDVAPVGSTGQKSPSFSPSPSGTTKTVRVTMEFSEPEQSQEFVEPKKDNRPIAIKTEDAEVDADSDASGQRVLSMEEIKEEAAAMSDDADQNRPQGGESAYAQAFKRAHGNAQEHQKSKDTELE